MNILLVDDDEVDRLAVARALRSAGLEATLQEAGSVAAAVTALGASAFDCVLLNIGRLHAVEVRAVLSDEGTGCIRAPDRERRDGRRGQPGDCSKPALGV